MEPEQPDSSLYLRGRQFSSAVARSREQRHGRGRESSPELAEMPWGGGSASCGSRLKRKTVGKSRPWGNHFFHLLRTQLHFRRLAFHRLVVVLRQRRDHFLQIFGVKLHFYSL